MKNSERYPTLKWTNPHLQHLVDQTNDVDLLQETGRTLKKARTGLRLTQAQLSTATGIPQKQISRIETGREEPTLELLARLAAGMGKRLLISFEDDTP